MAHPPERDWMIVAPWWQWTDPATIPPGVAVAPDPVKGRLSRPIIQKYDTPNLVNEFIKDPQRCLQYVDEDLVHALRSAPSPITNSVGKLLRMSSQQYVPDGTNTRKIFLETHKRFYLVVCDLRCDGPGFPKVAREKVCQAGFVIRRRTAKPPDCSLSEVKPILKSLTAGRARLTHVSQLAAIEQAALTGVTTPKLESLLKTRESLQALVALERGRFDAWATKHRVTLTLQGWFPSAKGFSKVGCWANVAEMSTDLTGESTLPLYPLIPDRNDPAHAGQFGTIYFGLLPTSSHDTDERGRARFDDQEYYEIRCWVLRHKEPHDPDRPCRCPDGVFWSVPTRPFKFASHFDLDGTSHQPVTIQLPDLNVLAAQAKPTLGVGLAKPKGSLMVSGDDSGKPQNKGTTPGFEICFFPIPLITIVATFVFELFLPVIVFLFQLWWMLALKFCIPPELSVAGGITAEIGLSGGIDIRADVSVDATIESHIDAAVKADLEAAFGVPAADALRAEYSPIALANMEIAIRKASAKDLPADATVEEAIRAGAPSVVASLAYEPEVTHA